MSDEVKLVAGLFSGLVLALVVITMVVGILNGSSDGSMNRGHCDERMSRIEYVLPFYRLGCWLGGKP